MPDQTITPVGAIATGRGTTGSTPVTSDSGTLTGHYLLVFASIDNKTPTSTTNPGISAVSGVDTWQPVGEARDPTGSGTAVMSVRAWLGKVTADGAKTVTLTGDSGANLIGLVRVLDAGGGAITVDALTTTIDRSSPFDHSSISPSGSKSLLVAWFVAYGQSSGGTLAMGAAPSGMTQDGLIGSSSGTTQSQVCRQTLSAAGATGTRSQTASGYSGAGGAGMLFALRSQTSGQQATAALSGTDTVTAGAVQGQQAAAALSGTDSVTAAASQGQQATVALSGVDTLSATGTRGQAAGAALSGTDTLTGAADRTTSAAAALAGTDVLTAQAGQQAAAALVGTSTLSAAATRAQLAAAALSGSDTLAAAAQQTQQTGAALTGADTLTAAATQGQPAAAALSGTDVLTAAALQVTQAGAALAGTDVLTAAATRAQPAGVALSGTDVLAVTGTAQTHSAGAALSGTDVLAAAAQQTHRVAAALAAADVLAVAVVRVQPAGASLSGVDELVAAGTRITIAAAALSGADVLAVGPVLRTAVVAAALTATTTLVARADVAPGGALAPTLWAVDPATGRLVALPHPLKIEVHDVENDAGAISVEYPVFGRRWELLRDNVTDRRDLEVEIWTEGRRATRQVGRLDQRQGDDVTEGAVWSFTGTLITGRLDEIVIAPQPLVGETTLGPDVEVTKASVTAAQWSRLYALGYRTSESEPDKVRVPQKVIDAVRANKTDLPVLADPKREVRFVSATPGAMLLFLLGQGWARGAGTDLTVDFTAAKDSAGVPWPETASATFAPDTNTVLSVAQWLAERGYIDFTVTPDRVVRAWRFGGRGTDRTTGARPTTLRRGVNLLQAGRRVGVRGAGTRFFVAGAEGTFVVVEDLDAQAARGRVVEVGSSIGAISDQDALTAAAQRAARRGVRGDDERTFALAPGVGMPRPGPDLGVGDLVRTDTAGQLGTDRVAQWTVTADVSGAAAQITTGDLIRSRAAALAKRLDDAQSGDTVIGTSTPSEDHGVPTAPAGLGVNSAAFLDGSGVVYASVTAGWLAVQSNTDGTAATDLDGYRVEWALETAPDVWQLGADVDAQHTSGSWTVTPHTAIRVRVRARDRSGNLSAWSPYVQHLTDDDATPPSVASTPAGADYLGCARWTWDGLTVDGADMLTAIGDFDYCALYMGTSGAFADAALVTQLYAAGSWTVADLPYGVTQYAWLVAVDTRGNRAAPSGRASATPGKVTNPDLGPGAVARAQIVDLAVGTLQLDNGAVNDLKVGYMSVGKLTGGIMSADVIVSGIFRTATFGLRTIFDNSGIRCFNAAEQLTIQLSGATGSSLFTGEIRTAASGARMVDNPGGSSPAERRFYPATTDQYARIKVLTSQSTTYPNQAGITMKGFSPRSDKASGEMSVFPAYARVAFAAEMDDGPIYSSIGAEKHQVGIGAPRVQIGAQSATGEAEDSVIRIGVLNNAGTSFVPIATAQWDNGGAYGYGRFLVPGSNCGFQFNNANPYNSVSVINNANNLIVIFASDFLKSSDPRLKSDLTKTPIDALAAVRAAPFYRYRLRSGRVGARSKEVTSTEIGVMADELPAEVVTADHNGAKSVSVYGMAAVLWGAVRDLASKFEDLENRVA